MDRLKHLQELLIQTPNDPFIIYGIALEYRNIDGEKTKYYFDLLLSEHPSYLPTYYQAGELYEDLDEDRAKEIYLKGMQLAKEQENMHAYGELKSVYDLLDMV